MKNITTLFGQLHPVDALVFWVAIAAAIITFCVSRQVLRDQMKLDNPGLLAFIVSALGFLGLVHSGNAVVVFLLIPAASLALSLLVLRLFQLPGPRPVLHRRLLSKLRSAWRWIHSTVSKYLGAPDSSTDKADSNRKEKK